MDSWVHVDSLTFKRFVAGFCRAAEPSVGLDRDMERVRDDCVAKLVPLAR